MAVLHRIGPEAAGSVTADFTVVSVNLSPEKGTAKRQVGEISIDSFGVIGDAHRDVRGRGVSLLDIESIEGFGASTGLSVSSGSFGENVTTRGLDPSSLSPGNILIVGGAELEVTAIGKTCHGDDCSIFSAVGRCIMPYRGVFCSVRSGGPVRAGDGGRVEDRTSQVLD